MTDFVIAHYMEDTRWLEGVPSEWNMFVYHKGPIEDCQKDWIPLPNVGRESHTYLHHIVSQYERLRNGPGDACTFFGQGDLIGHVGDWKRYVRDALVCAKREGFSHVHAREYREWKDQAAVWEFKLDNWKDHSLVRQAQGYCFGEWYETVLKRPFPTRRMLKWIAGANFAVRNDVIVSKPREFYATLLEDVSHACNPETGHFLERSWPTVFDCGASLIKKVPTVSCETRKDLTNRCCLLQLDTREPTTVQPEAIPYPATQVRVHADITPLVLSTYANFFRDTCLRNNHGDHHSSSATPSIVERTVDHTRRRNRRGHNRRQSRSIIEPCPVSCSDLTPDIDLHKVPYWSLTSSMNANQCASMGMTYEFIVKRAPLADGRSPVWLKLWYTMEVMQQRSEKIVIMMDTDAWIRQCDRFLDWLSYFESSPYLFMFAQEPEAKDNGFEGAPQDVNGGFVVVKNDPRSVEFVRQIFDIPLRNPQRRRLLTQWPAEQGCINAMLRENREFANACMMAPFYEFNTPTGFVIRHCWNKEFIRPLLLQDWMTCSINGIVRHA